jgi:hypothetical protein
VSGGGAEAGMAHSRCCSAPRASTSAAIPGQAPVPVVAQLGASFTPRQAREKDVVA